MQDEFGRSEMRRGKEQGRKRKSGDGRGSDMRLCITVPEAAAMLGVSRNFGYELAKQGKLPVVRFGKRLLIPRAALEKRLEEGVSTNQ